MSKPFAAKGAGACLKHDLNTRLSGRLCEEDVGDDGVDRNRNAAAPRVKALAMKHAQVRLDAAELELAFEPRLAEGTPFPPDNQTPVDTGLATLYRACSNRLARYFARRAGGDDALDLVHDAFMRFAALDPHATRAIARPEAYLNRVATNLLRDRARMAARRALDAQGEVAAPEAVVADPHRLLEEREALARLEQAVARMSIRRRRIFLLHRVEGLTYAQIGEEVGMSVKGVKKQMAKALFELRRDVGSL